MELNFLCMLTHPLMFVIIYFIFHGNRFHINRVKENKSCSKVMERTIVTSNVNDKKRIHQLYTDYQHIDFNLDLDVYSQKCTNSMIEEI